MAAIESKMPTAAGEQGRRGDARAGAVERLLWVMAQLGHADAWVTLSIYAQQQATDQALVWRLMRFAGEPEKVDSGGSFGPTNGPTSPALAEGAAGGYRLDAEESA